MLTFGSYSSMCTLCVLITLLRPDQCLISLPFPISTAPTLCICTAASSSCSSGGSGCLYFASQWTGQWALVWTLSIYSIRLYTTAYLGAIKLVSITPLPHNSQNWLTQWPLFNTLTSLKLLFSNPTKKYNCLNISSFACILKLFEVWLLV